MRLHCSSVRGVAGCVGLQGAQTSTARGIWGVAWKMADSSLALSPAVPVVPARRGAVRSNGYLGRREDAGGTSDGSRSSVVETERTPCSSSPAWDGRGGDVRARRVVHATYICVCSCLFRRAV